MYILVLFMDISIFAHVYWNVSVITQFITVHKCVLHHTAHQCFFILQLIGSEAQFLSVFIIPFSQVASLFKLLSILNLENIFQIRNIFITGSCYHILEIENVAEVHILWCVIEV